MASAMTRFEVQIPLYDASTPAGQAVTNFLNSLGGLAPYVAQTYFTRHTGDLYSYDTEINIIYGVLPTAQNATALGYLNALNAALQAAGAPTVVCIVWQVTSEP